MVINHLLTGMIRQVWLEDGLDFPMDWWKASTRSPKMKGRDPCPHWRRPNGLKLFEKTPNGKTILKKTRGGGLKPATSNWFCSFGRAIHAINPEKEMSLNFYFLVIWWAKGLGFLGVPRLPNH